MVSFLTLFLGIVVGRHSVAVSVAPGVAAVQFRVDAEEVGRLNGPPWTLSVDFGRNPLPHDLVATAFSSDGREIGRAHQWVNLPRRSAEIEVVLERDQTGVAIAGRYAFETTGKADEAEAAVTFDGDRIPASADGHFRIPRYDVGRSHLLSVSIDFPNDVRSQKDIALGGGAAEDGRSELTAIPLKASGHPIPTVASLSGRLLDRSERLVPIAVENGPAYLVVVREASADETLRRLGDGGRDRYDPFHSGFSVYDPEASRNEMSLDDDDELRFIWPIAEKVRRNLLFDKSRRFSGKEAGIHWLLTRISHPAEPAPDQRFADAVAVAGLQACASRSRRAVVLVLGPHGADSSRESPAGVRRYLAALRVPLRVWSIEPLTSGIAPAAWGAVEDTSTRAKLRAAVARLKRDLQGQSIVWIQGDHLPAAVSLVDVGDGVSLAD